MSQKHCIALLACITAVALSVRGRAQTIVQPAQGYNLRKNFVVMAIDDGPPENGPDGSNMQQKLIVALDRNGYPAEFMIVTCHMITGQPLITDINSTMCVYSGQNSIPLTLFQFMLDRGYVPRNHSDRHVPIYLLPDNGVTEFTLAQNVLDLFQPDGLALMRCPGLSCGAKDVAGYQKDPYLKKLVVINEDVGGGFVMPNGTTEISDTGCPVTEKLTVAQCGQLFIDAIRKSPYGVILLMHIRSEFLSGKEGNEFHLQTIQYVMNNLPEITWVPADAVPGIYGNVHIGVPAHVSSEFGTGDGQGPVLAAKIDGSGKAGLCKARDAAVWCKVPVHARFDRESMRTLEPPRFETSTQWFYISDPSWMNRFGSQFWLVDINQDGMADLVYPISDPRDPAQVRLMVAYSSGYGFSAPETLLDAPLDPRGIRFGDVNGDGSQDLVAWTPQGVLVYLSNGGVFSSTPVVASLDFPVSQGWGSADMLSAMAVRDVDGDGLADLVFDGWASVQVALSKPPLKQERREASTAHKGWSRFNRAQVWTYRMSNQQSGWTPVPQRNFQIVKISGKIGIAQGMPTGIVFHEADPTLGRFTLYRYLDNQNYTNVLDNWHPERYASGLVFADFEGNGNDTPLLVRPDGLSIGSMVEVR